MSTFSGIPEGRLTFTPIPNVVWSELLPLMDDLAEVKVTLHIFYLLSQKKCSPRYVTLPELQSDPTLMQSLEFKQENLRRGLARATAHGALLEVNAASGAWYFFNTPESRKALEKIASGELNLGEPLDLPQPAPQATPNIFKLYEQHIGGLSPLIADELQAAELDYPPDVILDAFRSAAEHNVRNWAYIRKILSDWTRRNKDEKTRRAPSRERRPTITGKLADVAKPK